MSRKQISEQIVEIVSRAAGRPRGEITLQSDLLQDVELTSLEIILMLGEIESAFQVRLPVEELYEVTLVEELVNCVEAQLAARPSDGQSNS